MSALKMPKILRRIFVSVLSLVVLFGLAGIIYVFLVDQTSHPIAAATSKKTAESYNSPLPTPVKPAANDPEGVAVQAITTPVNQGANASLTVETNAGSTCSINVAYNGVSAVDSGLANKTADAYGSVSWSWGVPSSTPLGTWPVKVTCLFNGHSAVVDNDLQVVKP